MPTSLEYRRSVRQFATTVVGCAGVAPIARNVRWATEPVDQELVNDIEAIVAPVLNTSWHTAGSREPSASHRDVQA
jgi:L-galactose dehydrogenase